MQGGGQSLWQLGKVTRKTLTWWVMWHAACLEGVYKMKKAMQDLLELHAKHLENERL